MKNIIKHKDEKWALIYKEFQHNSLDDLLITWEAAMFCGSLRKESLSVCNMLHKFLLISVDGQQKPGGKGQVLQNDEHELLFFQSN